MNAIVNTAPGRLEFSELPTPEPVAGQVRIRTSACAICATDLEMIDGWDRTGHPAIPGHEWSGYIDAVGPGGNTALLGRPVVAENVLTDGGEVGFEHPGGYAQYLLTEERLLHELPAGYPMPRATVIEPLAVCIRAVHRMGPLDPADKALVIGDGTIGLLTVALLRRAGLESIVCLGGRPSRLDVATRLGATGILNYHDADKAPLPGHEFDVVVEVSGSATGMETALQACAHDAHLIVVGEYGSARASFTWNTVLLGELHIVGSNASAGAWDEAVQVATDGEIPLDILLSRIVPASEYAAGMDTTRTDRSIVKVVLNWEDQVDADAGVTSE